MLTVSATARVRAEVRDKLVADGVLDAAFTPRDVLQRWLELSASWTQMHQQEDDTREP